MHAPTCNLLELEKLGAGESRPSSFAPRGTAPRATERGKNDARRGPSQHVRQQTTCNQQYQAKHRPDNNDAQICDQTTGKRAKFALENPPV